LRRAFAPPILGRTSYDVRRYRKPFQPLSDELSTTFVCPPRIDQVRRAKDGSCNDQDHRLRFSFNDFAEL
jgi:hypothetical protein